ncbi:hypothetical protein C8T65DRAFT_124631 [Cerioporus squamosus]|nr:hypothetical protein C8T65DRAFT_124631 [Cerioporus squamosus]
MNVRSLVWFTSFSMRRLFGARTYLSTTSESQKPPRRRSILQTGASSQCHLPAARLFGHQHSSGIRVFRTVALHADKRPHNAHICGDFCRAYV